jgi:hypothetical protein
MSSSGFFCIGVHSCRWVPKSCVPVGSFASDSSDNQPLSGQVARRFAGL